MPPPPAPDAAELAETRVTVHTGRQGFRSGVAVRQHTLVADEPKDAGGTDLGPTPYDLLGAALGTCTSMTLRMYADRKQWPLTGVTAHVAHARVHGDDCATCEEGEEFLTEFSRTLTLEGPLSDEQRQRLLEIADRCPVHRTLEARIEIATTLSPVGA